MCPHFFDVLSSQVWQINFLPLLRFRLRREIPSLKGERIKMLCRSTFTTNQKRASVLPLPKLLFFGGMELGSRQIGLFCADLSRPRPHPNFPHSFLRHCLRASSQYFAALCVEIFLKWKNINFVFGKNDTFFLFPGVRPEASPSVRVHRHLLRPWQRRRGHEVQGEHKRPIRVSEKFNNQFPRPFF